jgi:hypothetical protein
VNAQIRRDLNQLGELVLLSAEGMLGLAQRVEVLERREGQ